MEASGSSRSSLQPQSPAGPDAADPNASTTSSTLAVLARFEFETSKGNDGTKILMVEWNASAAEPKPSKDHLAGDWEVSWEGKTSYLPASDKVTGTHRRVYFLLPPGAPIPPLVTIARSDGPALTAKPLPAIFPPSLGVSNSDAGKRGVLHTIWAKKRLSELQDEIDAEMKANGESVGLEMALQERTWIIDHFGVGGEIATVAAQPLPNLISPRSPVGGRLGEKLKGLKLATSPADLSAVSTAKKPGAANAHFSLFPGVADMAVSSFSTFSQQAGPNSSNHELASASLDTVLNKDRHRTNDVDHDTEEDLFALPMSPRSPEMKRSPFSLL